jgi:hypothetical protein
VYHISLLYQTSIGGAGAGSAGSQNLQGFIQQLKNNMPSEELSKLLEQEKKLKVSILLLNFYRF